MPTSASASFAVGALVGAALAWFAHAKSKSRRRIRHHVLIQLKPGSSDAVVDLILEHLRTLPAKIEQIKNMEARHAHPPTRQSIHLSSPPSRFPFDRRVRLLPPQVGRQCAAIDDGRNVTLGGVVDFSCELDYQIYAKHAAHIAVIKEHILPHLAPGGRTAFQCLEL